MYKINIAMLFLMVVLDIIITDLGSNDVLEKILSSLQR